MIIQLGNGRIQMGPVRLADERWAVLFQKADPKHAIGERTEYLSTMDYVPKSDDVLIEISSMESAVILQSVVYQTVNCLSNTIHRRPPAK